jgi:hypothetical protein
MQVQNMYTHFRKGAEGKFLDPGGVFHGIIVDGSQNMLQTDLESLFDINLCP